MAKKIMVQGTMSDAGKSLLVTALCRIFKQDGYRVAPFKSQNMSNNSYITLEGLEMGRAQVAQAYAGGREPEVRMNPILLKPSSDMKSQLVVLGEVRGEYNAKKYYEIKQQYVKDIMDAYNSLAAENDIIVIEGAGSPAEINLMKDDFVNMGLAEMVDAPVIIAGDVDRGGVFAQLYGTAKLLPDKYQKRIRGFVVNKFRGEVDILTPGLVTLEELTGIPVLGVMPYLNVDIDDEDSMSVKMKGRSFSDVPPEKDKIDVAVIKLPRISNFTDFAPLTWHPDISVRYISAPDFLGDPDIIVLPGSKSSIGDLLWMRENGMEAAIKELHEKGTPILAVCGGYQMLGKVITDPDHVESSHDVEGMGLVDTCTTFKPSKRRTRVTARVTAPGPFENAYIEGYEIHMGSTDIGTCTPFCSLDDGHSDGIFQGDIIGTYLHGLFDSGEMTERLADWLLERKGMKPTHFRPESHKDYQERQFDILAEETRKALDMEEIYKITGLR